MTFAEPFGTKIGYVCKRYPRFSETFIVNEILAHEAAGWELEIFALGPVEETHFQDQIAKVRAPVTRFPDKLKGPEKFWKLLRETEQMFPQTAARLMELEAAECMDVAQGMMLAQACRQKGVVHLHAHFGTVSTTVARIAGFIAGITYSFTAHAKDIYHDYDEPVHLDLKIRDAASVVTVSDFNLDYLQEKFSAHPADIRRIYNGIDLTRFAYAAPNPKGTEILAVGRLVEKKGFHILVEAITLMKEKGHSVRCRIIGAGEEHANLTAQIKASNVAEEVILSGPMPQPDVISAMRNAAVLACPCVIGRDGNRDGLPTVLLEAMALGLPCVATDVTGISELVQDGKTGLCIPDGDPRALADALELMISDNDLRQQVSRNGRALIEAEYDVVQSSARMREIFDRVIAAQAKPKEVA